LMLRHNAAQLGILYIQNALIAREQRKPVPKKRGQFTVSAHPRPDRLSDEEVMAILVKCRDFSHQSRDRKLKDFRYLWTLLNALFDTFDVFIGAKPPEQTALDMAKEMLGAHIKALRARDIEPASVFGGSPMFGQCCSWCVCQQRTVYGADVDVAMAVANAQERSYMNPDETEERRGRPKGKTGTDRVRLLIEEYGIGLCARCLPKPPSGVG